MRNREPRSITVSATLAGATRAGATRAGATRAGATRAGATRAGATLPRGLAAVFAAAFALSPAWLAGGCSGDAATGGVTFDAGGTETVAPDVPTFPDEDVVAQADGLTKPDGVAPPADVPSGEDTGTPPVDAGDGACTPGDWQCLDDHRLTVCLPDGTGWAIQDCGDGTCHAGDCADVVCEPGERQCLLTDAMQSHAWRACDAAGTAWGEPQPCAADDICYEGVCLAPQCEPGLIVCAEAAVLVCTGDGLSWETTACEEGLLCFAGACVECVNADQCGPGELCAEDGVCAPEPVVVRPPRPPIGTEGEAYAYAFEAEGGLPPYEWSADGDVPPGLTVAWDGGLEGTPTTAGEFAFTVHAEDQNGTAGSAPVTVTIEPVVEGVHVTTSSPLPNAEEGEPYGVQLEAAGGTTPYAWMINSGALPAGLRMDATGFISGTPDMAVGEFPFRVRVFDNSDVPTWDQRELVLTVEIAPLEIIGDQQLDLLVTKVITLPLLTFIEGVPLLPYSTQLHAKGGLRPYHWTEIPIPDYLSFLIPRSGIPDGLTLHEDGLLEGNVGSSEDVVELTIPFTQITLRGFFFVAEVADSQDPAATKSAIFLIPTIPIGGN